LQDALTKVVGDSLSLPGTLVLLYGISHMGVIFPSVEKNKRMPKTSNMILVWFRV